MASGPITSWQIGETMETVKDLIFWGSKITADGDCSHEIKRHLLLGRKAMTNLKKWESEVAQSCPTLCDPMDCSLPGSSVHGIFQARVLEWVAISFSICDTYICKYLTLSFSTHLSKDTYVASISWLLEIILLWILVCIYCVYIAFIFWNECFVFFGYVLKSWMCGYLIVLF